MKDIVIVTGLVRLVSGSCLAAMGNNVLCLDKDPTRIKILEEGCIHIYKPGLQAKVGRNLAAGRLHFTTDARHATN